MISNSLDTGSMEKYREVSIVKKINNDDFRMVQNVLTQLCANLNKIFTETFLHPQIWDLKYLLMCKLQYLDTIHNLMNKFHMEKKKIF